MSKTICEICGTTYEESTGACPVCGWKPGESLSPSGDSDDILNEDFQFDDFDDEVSPQRGKAVFDYDAVNTRRRQPPKPAPVREEAGSDEEEEEESGSNKFLVLILVLLILALLAVSGYIAYTKLWKPSRMGSDDNKPQQSLSGETVEPTASQEPVTEPQETETTEATEPTVPCTDLSLVASMDTLTFAGQNWRLMVKYAPEDTTDQVTYTSGNEAVVTVDEYGRVTAVGEGETVIVVQCGDKRIQTPAVVSFATETTAATEPTPASGTSGTGTSAGTTVATPSAGTVLKLKKTDITIGRRGVYVTLELENGISAESVTWSTSDSSIATVYNGNVTALGRGTCVIRAEYNGQVAECVVRCNF